MKAARNKTIDLTVEEGGAYLSRCITVEQPAALSQVLDRTVCGDCFQVLPLLPEKFVDLLIVDPPYNLDKDFNGEQFRRRTDEAYRDYTEAWIRAVLPVLKPTASVYICCDWRSGMVIGPLVEKYFHLQNRITWQREKGRGAKNNWKNGMEDIYFATCGKSYDFHVENVMQRRRVIAPYRVDGAPKDWEETEDGRFRNSYPSNFWDDISIPYWSMPENTAHPTQKPEKLLAKLILASSAAGDVVLDPFLGSGSTSVAAKKLGRHFVGIEKNAQYCVWAEKRLESAETDRGIQGYTDGVFWERNTSAAQRRGRK
ncbi:MAG: site-specific DNA-methyltransferase [Ruminococcaceae bacterium]|nr:site-specific DNA-methyltransferase [Oscillospiraceae bacterium]